MWAGEWLEGIEGVKINKQERRSAKQLFQCCMVHEQLDEARVRKAVEALIRIKPRGFLPIVTHLHRLVRLEIARRTATVESTLALTDDLRRGVEQNLAAKFGPGLRYEFRVNPALLGGLRIKVGSDVFDGSVQAKLAALQESL